MRTVPIPFQWEQSSCLPSSSLRERYPCPLFNFRGKLNPLPHTSIRRGPNLRLISSSGRCQAHSSSPAPRGNQARTSSPAPKGGNPTPPPQLLERAKPTPFLQLKEGAKPTPPLLLQRGSSPSLLSSFRRVLSPRLLSRSRTVLSPRLGSHYLGGRHYSASPYH